MSTISEMFRQIWEALFPNPTGAWPELEAIARAKANERRGNVQAAEDARLAKQRYRQTRFNEIRAAQIALIAQWDKPINSLLLAMAKSIGFMKMKSRTALGGYWNRTAKPLSVDEFRDFSNWNLPEDEWRNYDGSWKGDLFWSVGHEDHGGELMPDYIKSFRVHMVIDPSTLRPKSFKILHQNGQTETRVDLQDLKLALTEAYSSGPHLHIRD